jgi:hypothetical protein
MWRKSGVSDGVASGQQGVAAATPMAYIFWQMKVVHTKRYLKDLKRLGVRPDEQQALERAIILDPMIGDVIPGLAGLRKLRFGFGGRGKRGGGRAIYFLVFSEDAALMIFAYAKNEQSDLTTEQRRAALALIRDMTDD